MVKFPSVPFATCLLPLQLLLQGSFRREEVKQPHHRDAQRPNIMHSLLEYVLKKSLIARPVEMSLGEETASQGTRSAFSCRPALLAGPVQTLWQELIMKVKPVEANVGGPCSPPSLQHNERHIPGKVDGMQEDQLRLCYITFKTRLSFKEHMKSGWCLSAGTWNCRC